MELKARIVRAAEPESGLPRLPKSTESGLQETHDILRPQSDYGYPSTVAMRLDHWHAMASITCRVLQLGLIFNPSRKNLRNFLELYPHYMQVGSR